MPPRTTKRHGNGALETMFQVQPEPVNAPAPEPGPGRVTRRRAVVQGVAADDGSATAVANAAVPTFRVQAQPTNIPAPAQPSPSCSTRYRATVEDVEDEGGPPMQTAANRLPHVTFETTPQRQRHQADPPLASDGPAVAPPPPASPNPQTPRNHPLSSPDGEHFPTPSSSSSEDAPSTPNTRHTPRPPSTPRARGTPRSGPHSPSRRRASRAPAGNKNRKQATDVRTFYMTEEGMHTCLFCKEKHALNPQYMITRYGMKTSTSVRRSHLCDVHPDAWIAGCDKLGIDITAKSAQHTVRDYRKHHNQASSANSASPDDLRKHFTPEAFVDAIVDFIVSDDQSINVIESPKLRAIFLMLREDLKDSDIPHRTTIRKRIMEVWDEHLDTLEAQMKQCLGKISFTQDFWSDPNLTPYMAVTAHWIETTVIHTADGPQYILKLRTDLIAFHHVPGRHTGDHMAEAFLQVLDRIGITSKIGWVTMDNASNNDTFMSKLEELLKARNIPFDKVDRRIRCFPHIVNLACKAILAAISALDFDPPEAGRVDDNDGTTFIDKLTEDPISRLRVLIRVIRASSVRRQCFSELTVKQFGDDVQLLRDVDTRWSSTCLMIQRALFSRPVIVRFLSMPDFEDLRRYYLSGDDWEALQAFYDILSIPHAFQQRLSGEKTPTLCEAIRSFSAIAEVWKEHQNQCPETSNIVQAGIDKLEEYSERTSVVPAYTVAMLLNPQIKLTWHRENLGEREVARVKQHFIRELRPYHTRNEQHAASSSDTSQANPPAPATPGRTPRTPGRSRTVGGQPRFNTPVRSTTTSWADKVFQLTKSSTTHSSGSRSLEREVETYLLDIQSGTSSISYWQENQLRYPTLFAAALDYLPIQGSAVPCERVFSSGKETTTMRRNRINHDLMEASQMLKFSLRSGHILDFTAGLKADNEVNILENMSEEEGDARMPIGNNFFRSLLDQNDW